MQNSDSKQDEYTHLLANDLAVIISSRKKRLPGLEWGSIQMALNIVQASLGVAQICEKMKKPGNGIGSGPFR